MFVWSTEWVREGSETRRQEVALNPRHSAGLDILWELGPARTGIELFYTGRQALDDNPYRERGAPYLLWGALLDWRLSARLRGYVNAENLGDVRQTKTERLIRQVRAADGRWNVDAWGPLEGRTINAGVRVSF
jgi:outer membrane receptor for ferrienterochelin and colicins